VHLTKSAGPALFDVLEEHGLTLSNVKVLNALDANDDVSVKELAEHLGLSLPGASRALDGLLKRGFVVRHEDAHDRRIKRAGLTDAGRELLARINAARLAGLEQFAADLTQDERDALGAALTPIADRLTHR
jgi:DNA-binding MarR family transcriptional regulator